MSNIDFLLNGLETFESLKTYENKQARENFLLTLLKETDLLFNKSNIGDKFIILILLSEYIFTTYNINTITDNELKLYYSNYKVRCKKQNINSFKNNR